MSNSIAQNLENNILQLTLINNQRPKRVGIIGYGHLGQFLRIELSKYSKFYSVCKIWNRSEEAMENVLPLTDLNEPESNNSQTFIENNDALVDLDLIIEVAHADVVKRYAKRILKHCDLFIASTSALADSETLKIVESSIKANKERRVYVPSPSAFWGTENICAMSKMGTLKGLKITIFKHPTSLRVNEPYLNLKQRALQTNYPIILYDGPARLLCLSMSGIANMIASAALAANCLGFDNTQVKLIADPALTNWSIIEYELIGENDFRTTCRRESPAQTGVINNEENTYYSILSSIKEAFYKSPGFHIC